MADQPESIPSSNSLVLVAVRSRARELSSNNTSFEDDDVPESTSSDPDMFLKDCALHLQIRWNEILSEYWNVDEIRDLDAYFEDLQGGLKLEESRNAKSPNEIEVLNGTYVEALNRLESVLEGLKHSLDFAASQDLEKAGGVISVDCSTYIRGDLNVRNALREDKFEILKHNDQIEKKNITLNSLKDLDIIYRRFEAIETIEDATTGRKVLDFDNNCIRLSLTTYIPHLEHLSCQHKISDITEPSELNHELLIEFMAGTTELKNVEIFPNDVYVGEIIDAAKSSRQLFSLSAMLETGSSLEWFVRKVQDRIILCTLRKYVIKGVNESRHSFEYLDRDEMIVAHMVGGISAFIKVSQGWPIINSALKLVSLKSSDHHSKGISLSFLCKVEEVANSLDVRIRQNISSFVDAIEETLARQMSLKLHSDVISD